MDGSVRLALPSPSTSLRDNCIEVVFEAVAQVYLYFCASPGNIVLVEKFCVHANDGFVVHAHLISHTGHPTCERVFVLGDQGRSRHCSKDQQCTSAHQNSRMHCITSRLFLDAFSAESPLREEVVHISGIIAPSPSYQKS